jgi:hypothetical protein
MRAQKPRPERRKAALAARTHADQHDAVTWCGADGSVGPVEFGLAAREAKDLRARHDISMKPGGAGVGPHDADPIGMVEKFDQPWNVAVAGRRTGGSRKQALSRAGAGRRL